MKKRTLLTGIWFGFLAVIIGWVTIFNASGAFRAPLDATPDEWFTNWAVVSTNVVLPLASVDEMNAAQAAGASGDIRQCMYGILNQLYGSSTNASGAGILAKMTVAKEQQYDRSTGESIITFSVSFRLTNTVGGVVGE